MTALERSITVPIANFEQIMPQTLLITDVTTLGSLNIIATNASILALGTLNLTTISKEFTTREHYENVTFVENPFKIVDLNDI